MKARGRFAVLLALLALMALAFTVTVTLPLFIGPAREEALWPQLDTEGRVRWVSRQLRCPQCQGLSAWESDSEGAWQVRDEVRRLVLAGLGPEAIRRQIAEAYGPWILMSPPLSGWYILAWLGPALGLGVAVGLIAKRPRLTRRKEPAMLAAQPPGEGVSRPLAPTSLEPESLEGDLQTELRRRLSDFW